MPQYATAAPLAILTFLLCACATAESDYPSLAIRDVERAEGQFDTGEPARINVPPVEVDLTGGLATRLQSLLSAAEQAHGDFLAVRPRATRIVSAARGSALGSDNWAAAQVVLAELDSARSRAAVPLGDLDMLYASAKVATEDTTAIETARGRVIDLVAEEDAILEDLRARVR